MAQPLGVRPAVALVVALEEERPERVAPREVAPERRQEPGLALELAHERVAVADVAMPELEAALALAGDSMAPAEDEACRAMPREMPPTLAGVRPPRLEAAMLQREAPAVCLEGGHRQRLLARNEAVELRKSARWPERPAALPVPPRLQLVKAATCLAVAQVPD